MVKYSSRSPRRTHSSRVAALVAATYPLCVQECRRRRTIRRFAIHAWQSGRHTCLETSRSPIRRRTLRRKWVATVQQPSDSTSQLHPQVHSTSPTVYVSSKEPTAHGRHSARSRHLHVCLIVGPPTGHFCRSIPLPLQGTPKSRVVNFKPLGRSGLRGGRSGRTQADIRPITKTTPESMGYRPSDRPAWSVRRQLPGPQAQSWEDH